MQGSGKYVPLVQHMFSLVNSQWLIFLRVQQTSVVRANRLVGGYARLRGYSSNLHIGNTSKRCIKAGPPLELSFWLLPTFLYPWPGIVTGPQSPHLSAYLHKLHSHVARKLRGCRSRVRVHACGVHGANRERCVTSSLNV